MSTSWTEKTTAVVAIVTLLIGAGGIIATVALYQGRIEEKVAQVDKRLERMEDKIDKIAPPTVRVGRGREVRHQRWRHNCRSKGAVMTAASVLDWLHIATALVTLASLVAALTPTPTDDAVLAQVRKLVDLVACNWGHAENAKPRATRRPVD